MNNTVLQTLTRKCGVKDGDVIIVALSGGADSVTLLHTLLSLKGQLPHLHIMAAHVNHKLRGEESERDMEFVAALCKERNIELFILEEDVALLAKERKQSIELCAREVRYGFFEELSQKFGAYIATAHTLSDSQETMLYNMARGASLHGLCSIPYKRGRIIRPLLDVSREQVEQYCANENLAFVQDSTNFCEDVCKRNKIRMSVLPPLRSLNEGFHGNFRRLREDLLNVDDFMLQTAAKAAKECRCSFGYSAEKLLLLHRAVLDYALMHIITDSGAIAENRHIALCRDILASGGAVMLPKGAQAICSQGVFRISLPAKECAEFELTLAHGLSFCFGDRVYKTQLLTKEEIINRKLASLCIACDKIDGAVIRTRQEGDTFTLQKRGITKPLRKLQNELKIPAELRNTALVAALGSTVLWAEHIGVSAQGAVSADTAQGIFIEIKDVENYA
ncbi:MAG: tRNA lysidine(34) synthetase TilS [Ruminococcus sp.]|nr:tRNA lysidine(34) synthetase TilS [Ruminococcus sp.]